MNFRDYKKIPIKIWLFVLLGTALFIVLLISSDLLPKLGSTSEKFLKNELVSAPTACYNRVISARKLNEISDFSDCELPKDWAKIEQSEIIPGTWKVYRDDRLGFEFKYPGDWAVVGVSRSGEKFEEFRTGSLIIRNHAGEDFDYPKDVPADFAKIDLTIGELGKNSNLHDFLKSTKDTGNFKWSYSDIHVGREVDAIEATGVEVNGQVVKGFFVQLPSKYVVEILVWYGYKQNKEIVSQILSSFQFVK